MRAIPLFILLCLLSNCEIYYPAAFKPREAQETATVRITTICTPYPDGLGIEHEFGKIQVKFGSGVIMGDREILTAAHVVRCPEVGEYQIATTIGSHYRVVVSRHYEEKDVAWLVLESASHLGIAPAIRGRVTIGETVCSSFAAPSWGHSCGEVVAIDEDRAEFTGLVEHGNSGAGVYNLQGELVGLISAIDLTNGNGIIVTGIY